MISNVIMFILGAAVMGRWFAFNTAVSTFCYPIFLELFSWIPGIGDMTRDPMLATVFAGVMIGAAICAAVVAFRMVCGIWEFDGTWRYSV